MSYTKLKVIRKNGSIKDVETFGNAWGFCARVWDALGKRYFGWSEPEWLLDEKEAERVWGLQKDPRMSRADLLTLLCTFDYAIIDIAIAKEIAQALRTFASDHPRDGKIDNLPAIADAIEKRLDLPIIGFCFHANSVTEDLWSDWDEEKEKSISYDLKTGDKHFFVSQLAGATVETDDATRLGEADDTL